MSLKELTESVFGSNRGGRWRVVIHTVSSIVQKVY